MEFYIFNYLNGFVCVRVTGEYCDRFLNLCAYHELRLWHLIPEEDGYRICMRKSDFKKLRSIVRKCHVKVQIIEKNGLPFFIRRYRRRKGLVAGLLSAFLLLLWLSSHIWNISIEGNLSQTDDVIFEYLEQEGICHGMRKKTLDCKVLAAQIRDYFPEFTWTAAKLQGTRLIITVKEGILDNGQKEEVFEERAASSLISGKSGTVISIYARKGIPLVKAGDSVEKGSVLVSGVLPIYNDSREISDYQYVNADADVVLESKITYSDSVSLAAKSRSFTGNEKNRYSLRIGSLAFALPFARSLPYENCTVLRETKQIKLSENFFLPVFVQKFTAKEYEIQEMIYTKEEAEEILKTNLYYFMKNLEEKGVQIFENGVKIEWTEKSAIATGTLTVGENAVIRVAVDQSEEELQSNEYG